MKTFLDNNDNMARALVAAVKLAERHIADGFYRTGKRGELIPKITGKEVVREMRVGHRVGHIRALSAAYRSVFFNHNLED